MKIILMAVVMLGLAGGAYAADFSELGDLKAAGLKALAAAEGIAVPEVNNRYMEPVEPATPMEQLSASSGGNSKIYYAPVIIGQAVDNSGGDAKSQNPSRARLRQFMCSGIEGSRFMVSGELDSSNYGIRNAAYSTYSPGASAGLFHLEPDYSYRPSGDNIGTLRFFFPTNPGVAGMILPGSAFSGNDKFQAQFLSRNYATEAFRALPMNCWVRPY